MKSMGKRVYFWLLIILIIASFFRLWNITTTPPGLYPDEAINGNNAREALENWNFNVFYPENNGREGLYMNIVASSLALFGNEPWAIRIISALFGILTVLGIYFLAKELLGDPDGKRVALFAAFLLAVSFWHINFSRIGFRAIMAPFFLVWSFYFLFGMIRKLREKGNNSFSLQPELFAIISGIFFGLGFHSYIAYRIAPLLLIVPLLRGWKEYKYGDSISKDSKCFPCLFALFLFFAMITALPLGYYFLQNPDDFLGRTAQVSIFSSTNPIKDLGSNTIKTIGMFFWQGDYNWRHNFAGAPQLWWPVGILFLTGFLITLRKFFNRRSIILNLFTTSHGFLFLWFLIFMMPVITSNEGIPHALRAIILIPPTMIFAALGLEWIRRNIRARIEAAEKRFPHYSFQLLRIKKELVLLLFVFFLSAISHAFNQYFFRWGESPYVADAFSERYVAIGKYLNTLPEDISKYVIVNVGGVDVRGIPISAQTVMFITYGQKNISYIVPQEINQLQLDTKVSDEKRIVMLEEKSALRAKLKEILPRIQFESAPGYLLIGKITK